MYGIKYIIGKENYSFLWQTPDCHFGLTALTTHKWEWLFIHPKRGTHIWPKGRDVLSTVHSGNTPLAIQRRKFTFGYQKAGMHHYPSNGGYALSVIKRCKHSFPTKGGNAPLIIQRCECTVCYKRWERIFPCLCGVILSSQIFSMYYYSNN